MLIFVFFEKERKKERKKEIEKEIKDGERKKESWARMGWHEDGKKDWVGVLKGGG